MPGKVQGLTPEAAVDRLEDIYAASCGALTQALDRYLVTGEPPSAAERAARQPLRASIESIHRLPPGSDSRLSATSLPDRP